MNLFNDPEFFVPDVSRVRSVLFVCLGNICRSPTAHGVFEHMARERGVRDQLRIESCGTGDWHAGSLPDPRTMAAAEKRGILLTSRARVVLPERDFGACRGAEVGAGFELILPMDTMTRGLLLKRGCPKERIVLFRVFDPESVRVAQGVRAAEASGPHLEVPDPYYGPLSGFDEVFEMVQRAAAGLLDRMFPGTAALKDR